MTGQSSGHDRRIGMDFGGYKITRPLAVGGMGAVYIAEHRGMKKVVKFMLGEFATIPDLRLRFERECDAAIRLKGKTNIVDIDSHDERDGELYLVMEYLDGETLDEHVRRRCGRISIRHAFRLISQIIAALHELHSSDIIHRDLKPHNIFVVPTDEEPYRVKLIDFGIVHDRRAVAAGQGGTRRGAIIGTPGYAATEQYGQAGSVTPAADVFALAVIIVEMFCGQRPWSAANEFELYPKQLHQPPSWPPGYIPLGWEPILRAALSPQPTDRPPLHALLYALARDIPSEPPEPDGLQMVTRYAPRVLMSTPVDIETARASNAQQASAALWALQRATAVPAGDPKAAWFTPNAIALTAPGHTPPSVPVPSAPNASSSSSPETVHARPVAAPAFAAKSTTIGASSGAMMPVSPVLDATRPGPRRSLLALLGVGVAVLAGGAIVAVTTLRSQPAATHPVSPASPPATLDPSQRSIVEMRADAAIEVPPEAVKPSAVPPIAIDAGVPQEAAQQPTRTIKKPKRPSPSSRGSSTRLPPKPPDDPDAPAE